MKKFKFNFLPDTKAVWIGDIICSLDQISIWQIDDKFIIRIADGRKYAGITGPRFYEVGFSIPVSKEVFTKEGLHFQELTNNEIPKWFFSSKEDAQAEAERMKINEESKNMS